MPANLMKLSHKENPLIEKSTIKWTGTFRFALAASLIYSYYSLFTISVTLFASPARPWISEGIIILVALPSAAF